MPTNPVVFTNEELASMADVLTVLNVWPDAELYRPSDTQREGWCSIIEPHSTGNMLIGTGPTSDAAWRNAADNARAAFFARVEREAQK